MWCNIQARALHRYCVRAAASSATCWRICQTLTSAPACAPCRVSKRARHSHVRVTSDRGRRASQCLAKVTSMSSVTAATSVTVYLPVLWCSNCKLHAHYIMFRRNASLALYKPVSYSTQLLQLPATFTAPTLEQHGVAQERDSAIKSCCYSGHCS
jgi:hypothetical protein